VLNANRNSLHFVIEKPSPFLAETSCGNYVYARSDGFFLIICEIWRLGESAPLLQVFVAWRLEVLRSAVQRQAALVRVQLQDRRRIRLRRVHPATRSLHPRLHRPRDPAQLYPTFGGI
jgi:hypothetical protein